MRKSTASFAASCACRKTKIAASADVFRHMLGLIQGRVYYNLLNWYRLIALLPGFQANRGFMEQMMGVKEALPDHLIADMTPSTWSEPHARIASTCWAACWRMAAQSLRHQPPDSPPSIAGLHDALGDARPDLEPRRPDELVAYYRDLEATAADALGRPAGQRLLRDDLLRPARQADPQLVRRHRGHAAKRSALRRRRHDLRGAGRPCACHGRVAAKRPGPDGGPVRCAACRPSAPRSTVPAFRDCTRNIWSASATAAWRS